jgi:signal transduction histidine kinase
MHATTVAADQAASRGKRRFGRGDLQFAGLVLALCAWDTIGGTLVEAAFGPDRVDWLARFANNALFSLITAVPGAAAVWLLLPGYPTSLRRCFQVVAVYLVGTTVGHTFAIQAITPFSDPSMPWVAQLVAQSIASHAIIAGAVAGSMYWWHRATLIRQQLQRTQIDLLATKADHADAELLRLRTQIEPHFLFNTIANIVQMVRTDAAAADRALARLIDYMDASHAHMRRHEAALAEELVLTEGYLEIQRLRMGARLRYEIDVAAELRSTPIPPAALLTLVENAIKHGLAPQTAGGTVRVSARREGGSVVLSVADDGAGLRAASGRGLGLANVRARVQGLYGGAASLRLASAAEGGTMATIRLPFVSSAAGTGA